MAIACACFGVVCFFCFFEADPIARDKRSRTTQMKRVEMHRSMRCKGIQQQLQPSYSRPPFLFASIGADQSVKLGVANGTREGVERKGRGRTQGWQKCRNSGGVAYDHSEHRRTIDRLKRFGVKGSRQSTNALALWPSSIRQTLIAAEAAENIGHCGGTHSEQPLEN